MDIKDYVKQSWYKIVYALIVVIYLICLNGLNERLLERDFASSFELLAYDNGIAMKYFIYAMILFIVGCVLLYREVKSMIKVIEDFEGIEMSLITIIILIALLIMIIVLINNPILRAIMCSIFLILGAGYLFTN